MPAWLIPVSILLPWVAQISLQGLVVAECSFPRTMGRHGRRSTMAWRTLLSCLLQCGGMNCLRERLAASSVQPMPGQVGHWRIMGWRTLMSLHLLSRERTSLPGPMAAVRFFRQMMGPHGRGLTSVWRLTMSRLLLSAEQMCSQEHGVAVCFFRPTMVRHGCRSIQAWRAFMFIPLL